MSVEVSPRHGVSVVSLALAIALISICPASISRAAFITYDTPSGSSTGGQPVSAEVSFTTSADTVQIVLKNTQANPKSAVQCLSGLQFHLSGGQNSATLLSSSGIDRSISGSGAYSDGASVSTGWFLENVGSDLKLNDLGGDAPQHTIVGPPDNADSYSSANSSISNDPHNPHIGQSATFTLKVPCVTAASTITSVTFQFGTSSGNNVSGVVAIPEPASASVVAMLGVAALSRRVRSLA